ncbi:hypothetical protein CRYUN_Cryun05aG0266500 [Craigia yunnanensis]
MSQRKMNQLKNGEEHEEGTLPELPEHIFIEILAKIPPKFLYETFRYVCKAWYTLICNSEFIDKNALHHKHGILIQVPKWPYRLDNKRFKTSFLQMDEKELDFNLTNFGPSRMGLIRSSCNGLILVSEPREKTSVLCVKNFLTGSALTLPSCPSGCKHGYGVCGSALGFNPITKEYKVVHMYADGYGFEMFTIGSDDEWRRIPGPFKEASERPFNIEQFRWSDPVSIERQVLHWFVDSEKYIISMNIRDEKVSKTNLPDFGRRIIKHKYELLEMDGKLSFVYKASKYRIDVWVLKDFGRQVWSKEHSIIAKSTNYITLRASSGPTKKDKDQSEGGGQKDDDNETNDASLNREEKKDKLPDFAKLAAVATLRNGEVIMLKHKKNSGHHDLMYLYDFKHEEMRKFKMKMKEGQKFIPHRSSLVSWRTQSELSAEISNISL